MLDNTNDDLGRSTVESRSSWKSLLTNRLLLALLTVSLVPLAFMGVSTYRSASSALESQALNQLETVRTITAKSVRRYFVTLEDQLRVLSEDQMTIAAVKEFTSGMAAVASDDEMTAETVADARQQLIGFYEGDVAAAYRERGQEPPLARDLVDGLDEDAALLQHLYLASNKNPIGSKDRLDNPDDGSRYSQSHASYHPIFRSIQQKFGLYDLFLVDAESGDIVYSVFKETDFATSLRTGAFASSSIGSAFTEAVNRGRKDTVAFADFRPYLPSYSPQRVSSPPPSMTDANSLAPSSSNSRSTGSTRSFRKRSGWEIQAKPTRSVLMVSSVQTRDSSVISVSRRPSSILRFASIAGLSKRCLTTTQPALPVDSTTEEAVSLHRGAPSPCIRRAREKAKFAGH